MTKVKICGITNLEDAMLSAKFGADALGFNFYPKSPRYILSEDARKIIDELPEDILNVGVFVNEDLEKVVEVARTANLDAIQLHGEETPEFAKKLKEITGLEIIKAFRVSSEFQPEDVLQYEVDAILLDAYSPTEHGGTGETFDWEIAKKVKEIFPKMYLAGGLNHDNVLIPIYEQINPYYLDVCSGIELRKGKKDYAKLINFITKLKSHQRMFPKVYEVEQSSTSIELNYPNNIYEFLECVHIQPSIYLGEKSASKLGIFLMGITLSLSYTNSSNFKGNFGSIEYDVWMSERISIGFSNSLHPMSHLLKKFDNDEVKAFDYYFAYLEEFKLEHGIK